MNGPAHVIATLLLFVIVSKQTGRLPLNLDEKEHDATQPRRPIWPWLLLAVLTLLAIYAYTEVTAMIDDTVRLWNDLVQLFWWIVPDQPS